MFIDRARLVVQGGDGGRGVISFRREAHVPRGGPDGGDGGKGGDVVLRVDPQLGTLADFRFTHEARADSGKPGAGRKSTGRSGADRVLLLPPGTIVIDRATNATVADLVTPGEELVVARGGVGGKGNARFASSTRRAPRIAEDGGKGERREIDLELKLLADVGLAGMPNARAAIGTLSAELAARDVEVVAISAAAREGTDALLRLIFERCPPRETTARADVTRERRIAFGGGATDWRVSREGGAFRVSGDRVERLASGIDWASPEASAYFQHHLLRSGIDREL